MNLRRIFGFLVFLVIVFPSHILALESNAISVDIVPPNPGPQENTDVTLSSYTYNLDSVLINWKVDGKDVASGIAKKTISVTTPAIGEEMNIVAEISLPEGIVYTKIALRPSSMVLLWQANDSYVPPFYRGKALPSADSEIKVVAMPEIRTSKGGALVDPKNMIYLWKKDYTNDAPSSGYGKNFFSFVIDYLENSNIVGVVVSTLDQKSSGAADVRIEAVQPNILFYKNDSELGTLWQKSLGNHKIEEKEVLEAAPYFISPKELFHPSFIWRWFINDALVSLNDSKKNLMPLQVESGVHGVSRLQLEIENRHKIFQTTNREINIEF